MVETCRSRLVSSHSRHDESCQIYRDSRRDSRQRGARLKGPPSTAVRHHTIKSQVSFAKEPHKRDNILQKSPRHNSATHCNTLQHTRLKGLRQTDDESHRVLQCVAVCCSALHCVAVRCIVLQMSQCTTLTATSRHFDYHRSALEYRGYVHVA